MDTEFKSVSALHDEVTRLRDGGEVLLYAPDPKTRRVGFVAGDEFLFVRMSALTKAQLDQVVRGEDVFLHPACLEPEAPAEEPLPDGLWGEGFDRDGVETANDLIEGEKAAKKGWEKFPTPDQMHARVTLIEEGLRRIGVTTKVSRSGGSPFTFRWALAAGAKTEHAGRARIVTDHLGVTFVVDVQHGGVSSEEVLAESRLTWSDPEFTPEGVAAHTRAVLDTFAQIPPCQCEDHKMRRAGRGTK